MAALIFVSFPARRQHIQGPHCLRPQKGAREGPTARGACQVNRPCNDGAEACAGDPQDRQARAVSEHLRNDATHGTHGAVPFRSGCDPGREGHDSPSSLHRISVRVNPSADAGSLPALLPSSFGGLGAAGTELIARQTQALVATEKHRKKEEEGRRSEINGCDAFFVLVFGIAGQRCERSGLLAGCRAGVRGSRVVEGQSACQKLS